MKRILENGFFILSIPILIPYSFCAFLFFLIFFPVGFFENFVPFLVGSSYGVVIAYCYKIVPFLILITFPNLLKISKDEISLHRIYCSSEFYFFKNILIKRVLSILFIGAFIVFSYIFNAFEIPSILGSNIDKMPAVFVNDRLQEFGLNSLNMAYGSSLLYFFITLGFGLVFFLFYKIIKKVLF